MRTRLALSALGLAIATTGCITQHDYDKSDELDLMILGELFGDVGSLKGFENRFELGQGQDSWASSESISVSNYDNQVFANIVAGHPQGNAYIDVTIDNFDRMEPGVPYSVTLPEGYEGEYEGDYYAVEGDAESGEPTFNFYACPSTGGQSGSAQEITMVREEHANGASTIDFSVAAPNDRQQMALDGWLRVDPNLQQEPSYY